MFRDVDPHNEALFLYHEERLEAEMARNAIRRALRESAAVDGPPPASGPHRTPFRPSAALHHHRGLAVLHR